MGNALPSGYKQLSALRRIEQFDRLSWQAVPGVEGCVGVFRFPPDAEPVILEAVTGRSMTIIGNDIFLATPGHRESVRWTVGGVPASGLLPGQDYWILSESGVVGQLFDQSKEFKSYLGKAQYLGAVAGPDGRTVLLKDYAIPFAPGTPDAQAPVYLVLGTSVDVGKTTAGLTLVRTLLSQGHQHVTVLKATGTTCVTEAAMYRDCIDFGLPTTFPSARPDAADYSAHALDVCLSRPADAVVIECGGDFMGTCVPEFLQTLRPRRSRYTTILAAADVSGAIGAKQILQAMGISLNLITGPCTDTMI